MKYYLAKLTLLVFAPCLISCEQTTNNKDMVVTTMDASFDATSPEQEICSSFELSKENIGTYYSVADLVDEYEFNKDAVILPCHYEGNININGEPFRWKIAAGGAGYLYSKTGVDQRYLCRNKCCEVLKGMC